MNKADNQKEINYSKAVKNYIDKLQKENKELINMVDEVLDDRDYFMNKLKQAESRISELEKKIEEVKKYLPDGFFEDITEQT